MKWLCHYDCCLARHMVMEQTINFRITFCCVVQGEYAADAQPYITFPFDRVFLGAVQRL